VRPGMVLRQLLTCVAAVFAAEVVTAALMAHAPPQQRCNFPHHPQFLVLLVACLFACWVPPLLHVLSLLAAARQSWLLLYSSVCSFVQMMRVLLP